MSTTNMEVGPGPERTSRRYRDGDSRWTDYHEKIFQAGWSHKCPTFVQSTPPCQAGCPSGEDIRGWLNVVRGLEKPPMGADGKPAMAWQEYAWRRLTRSNPLPAVVGRVCPAPCESGCNRSAVDDHVGINAVEHYLGDWAIRNGLGFQKPATRTGRKVAVIGSGPAGLSCAYQLALKGHGVTLFEEREHLGGMMRYGIPGFRTPRDVLDAEIQRILDLGIETRTRCRIGTDVTLDELRVEFDAVFLGLGAQGGRALPVPDSENVPNVVTAAAFLRAFNDGRLKHVGKRVVVVGGGDTSLDVATVARRLGHVKRGNQTDFEEAIAGRLAQDVAEVSSRQGADVVLTSVHPIDRLPANRHEIEQALAEGIQIRGGLMPVAVIRGSDGRAVALRVAECETAAGGKRVIKPGTEQDLEADLIVSAIGQAVDFTGLEVFDNGKGLISTDRNFQIPAHGGVFAGGDVLKPHLLTTAVGHGAIAARGIDRYLQGLPPEKRPKVDVDAFDLVAKYAEKGVRFEEIHQPLRGTCDSSAVVHNFDNRSDRYVIPREALFLGHFGAVPRQQRQVTALDRESALGNFEERLRPLDEALAVAEAKRCMSCGLCVECDNCVVYCPQSAIRKVPKREAITGRYVLADYDRCIGCHICRDVCPTGYIQMGLGE